jgi:hypothetical protein
MAQSLRTRIMKLSLNRRHLLTIKLTHLQNVSQQGLLSAWIFGMPTSLNPFTRRINLDLILTLLLTLCKHICVTNRVWFPRKRSVNYRLSPGKPGPSYPMMFGWYSLGSTGKWQPTFPGIYSQAIFTWQTKVQPNTGTSECYAQHDCIVQYCGRWCHYSIFYHDIRAWHLYSRYPYTNQSRLRW